MDNHGTTIAAKPDRRPTLLVIGPILLFLTATVYGILEIHSNTDAWIGLAAGRQILTTDEFPTTDTFSYTFHGETWYNQNWLTHLCQYWLYSRITPDAVAYATWALSAGIFGLVLLAAYWRSGTWIGALLAASVVGLGCRDFLGVTPATTGFFCLAGLWALLCALESQRDRRRWWPIPLLLPLLLVWGNAHGSFVFAYGVLGLYVGHWFVVRTVHVRRSWSFSLVLVLLLVLIGGVLYSRVPPGAESQQKAVWAAAGAAYYVKKLALLGAVLVAYGAYWACVRRFRPRLAISDRQVAAIAVVVVLALVLTVLLGPFGIDNFTHVTKIAGSRVFRGVSEWHPPTAREPHFPPVWPFWTILGISLGLLLAGALPRLIARRGAQPGPASERLHTSLFDVAVVIVGLSMTFWARRFAPIYYIAGAPVFLTWIVLLSRSLPAWLQRHLRTGVMVGAGVFAIHVGYQAYAKTRQGINRHLEEHPQFDLLERVTRDNVTPHDAILFLKNNELNVNLLTDWTHAGPVMFYVPNARVFIDGRAQQVYDEGHYKKFGWLMTSPDMPHAFIIRTLDDSATDAVLLRRTRRVAGVWGALEESREWVPVLLSARGGVFLRKRSRGLAQLAELVRRGAEWRPEAPLALAGRGFVWQAMTSPDLPQAIACWQAALREDVTLGSLCFRPVTKALLELGREREAHGFVETHYRRLDQPFTRLPDELRRDLLETLSQCRREIEAALKRQSQLTDPAP